MQATNGVAVSERWQAFEATRKFSGEHMFRRSSNSSLKMPRSWVLWRCPSVQEMAEFPGQKLPRGGGGAGLVQVSRTKENMGKIDQIGQ